MFRVVTDACVSQQTSVGNIYIDYVRLGSTILFGPLDTPTETSGPHLWIYLSAMPHVVLLQPQRENHFDFCDGGRATANCTYVTGLQTADSLFFFFFFFPLCCAATVSGVRKYHRRQHAAPQVVTLLVVRTKLAGVWVQAPSGCVRAKSPRVWDRRDWL